MGRRAVETARVLSADAVQKIGNGHPGTAMSLAPAAYTLFRKVMRHDPCDAECVGRDRFVLSAGHSSLTHYTQLYLDHFGASASVTKLFRSTASLPPRWPERVSRSGWTTCPAGGSPPAILPSCSQPVRRSRARSTTAEATPHQFCDW
ncbi:hypothetical protein JIX55_49295 [Streptomyces sp. DSM 40750]|nr:hypothetical protein [Streptomyces sp. DSM 40750]UUU27800.1 hypothetical protein JIX55_01450 [Streptomyces sp. DSM 40750]UUU28391.1 hypothetical protein JIX55_49295 [Streptomyces sp. DSM 40750]